MQWWWTQVVDHNVDDDIDHGIDHDIDQDINHDSDHDVDHDIDHDVDHGNEFNDGVDDYEVGIPDDIFPIQRLEPPVLLAPGKDRHQGRWLLVLVHYIAFPFHTDS